MMVPKIITYAATIVAQNKKDGVQVIGRGAHSKSKRHSPPASLSGNFTKMPGTKPSKTLIFQVFVVNLVKNVF